MSAQIIGEIRRLREQLEALHGHVALLELRINALEGEPPLEPEPEPVIERRGPGRPRKAVTQ